VPNPLTKDYAFQFIALIASYMPRAHGAAGQAHSLYHFEQHASQNCICYGIRIVNAPFTRAFPSSTP